MRTRLESTAERATNLLTLSLAPFTLDRCSSVRCTSRPRRSSSPNGGGYHLSSPDALTSPEANGCVHACMQADIIIPLDDLPSADFDADSLARSVERTHRWEARSLSAHLDDPRQQAMYGVIHGGLDRRLRASSAELLTSWPFDGFCIGGSLGRDRGDMASLLRDVSGMLPTGLPNHLLGVGDEESVRMGVALGIDTFDSSWPTRLGRHGTLLTRQGQLRINQARCAKAAMTVAFPSSAIEPSWSA